MTQTVRHGLVTARIRECWILVEDRRKSCTDPGVFGDRPVVRAVAVEWLRVPVAERRRGHARQFIEHLCRDPRFDLVVIEMVQNPHLRAALARWGWACDESVQDYFFSQRNEVPHDGRDGNDRDGNEAVPGP